MSDRGLTSEPSVKGGEGEEVIRGQEAHRQLRACRPGQEGRLSQEVPAGHSRAPPSGIG